LTGPGGVGKTRLALEAGRRVAPRFTDGVGFVPLAPSPDGLVATIAAALRLPRVSTEPPDASVTAEPLDRAALLILDNFESVIEFATQIGDLMAAAPRLRLLVTSRVALRLTGEQAVAVAPLTVPDPDARSPQSSSPRPSHALTGLCFLTLALARFDGREDEFEAMLDAARACEDPVYASRSRSATAASSGWPAGTSHRRSS
jgi:predicted ATPase